MSLESAIPAGAGKHHAPRVAVIGTGSIGKRHLHVLKNHLGVDPIAVPTRSSRLDQLKSEGFKPATSLREAVCEGDFVVVCTDTARHLEFIRQALLQRSHVLSEKPLSSDIRGLAEIAELARSANCRVYVGCVLRFDPGLQQFRNCLPRLGRIFAVRIECQSYLPDWVPGRDYRHTYSARASEGGVLRDMIHEIDYALWLFGKPQSVYCNLSNTGLLGIEADETADLLWRTDSHVDVSIRLDYLTRTARRSMTAYGANGELAWDAIKGAVTLSILGESPSQWDLSIPRDEMFAAQASAFLQPAQGNAATDLATFEEGAFAIALCDAARQSSLTRKEELIPDWRKP